LGGGLEVNLKTIWSGCLVESCLVQVETWIEVAVVILEKVCKEESLCRCI